MKNSVYQENRAKDCQEIDKLRRICCERAARQLRFDELCMQQKENQLLFQSPELQDKVNSLNDAKEFYDPETASSAGFSNVPSQPVSIPSPRGMISRDCCLPHDTRNSMGSSGNVSENLPAQEEPSSVLVKNPRILASSSC